MSRNKITHIYITLTCSGKSLFFYRLNAKITIVFPQCLCIVKQNAILVTNLYILRFVNEKSLFT